MIEQDWRWSAGRSRSSRTGRKSSAIKIVKADTATKLLSQHEVEAILNAPHLMRLGFLDESGWPAVAPVWVLYQDGRLFTTVESGSRKTRCFEADDRVYFTIDHSGPEGTFGVRGPARAKVIEDRELAIQLTKQSLQKYLGSEEGPMAEALLKDAEAGETAVVELVPLKWAAWSY